MMLRTIPRVAIGGSLTLIRLPVDGALRLAGGGDSIELALDRAEATVRSVAGFALSDDVLIQDAARRHEVADERERALLLHAEAVDHAERAEERLNEGRQKATQTRASAAAGAEQQQRDARRRGETRKSQAAEAAEKREAAAAKAAAEKEEAIEDREKRSRLENLEKKAEALEERDEALTKRDEARRLQEAAAQAKADRKAK